MLYQFQTLLTEMVADPDKRISQLTLLDETHRRQLLTEWNDTSHNFPVGLLAHREFERQASQSPGAVAVIDGPRMDLPGNQRAGQPAGAFPASAQQKADQPIALRLKHRPSGWSAC